MSNLTLKGFEETPELVALRNKESKYAIFGVRLLLDEDKIKELGYTPEQIYKSMDRVAQQRRLIKVGHCAYAASRTENDLSDIGLFCSSLIYDRLFYKYVKEWIMIEGKNCDLVQDYLASIKKIKLGNFKNEQ